MHDRDRRLPEAYAMTLAPGTASPEKIAETVILSINTFSVRSTFVQSGRGAGR